MLRSSSSSSFAIVRNKIPPMAHFFYSTSKTSYSTGYLVLKRSSVNIGTCSYSQERCPDWSRRPHEGIRDFTSGTCTMSQWWANLNESIAVLFITLRMA
jgi:hypothetical protein